MRFQQIYDWIEVNKPEVILEVGTWNGHNAKRMLSYGAKKYIGFDVWEEGSEELDELENNAKKRVDEESAKKLIGDSAELIKGNTRITLPGYVVGKKPFVDMALIDGGHSKGTIKSDLLNVFKLVRTEGVVFLDDYYFNCPEPNMGAQCVLGELNIPYTVLPVCEKSRDGSLIKIAQISMRDVPRNDWDYGEEVETWQFEAA